VLEGKPATAATQSHLDRCLTCRNCESTCPSGVQYGRLVDIGRKVVEEQVQRPLASVSCARPEGTGAAQGMFRPAMKAGQMVRPLCPSCCRTRCHRPQDAGTWPTRTMRADAAA
jgi:glycolate oxidase iron-sulfur subunit